MSEIVLFTKIKSLPEPLKLQVTDYIDFLLQKYALPVMEPSEITTEEKEELERRVDDFEANPSAAVPFESVMNKMLASYGL